VGGPRAAMATEASYAQAALLGLGVSLVAYKRFLGAGKALHSVVLRVGGVPEHFNIPVHDAAQELARRGVAVKWTDQPGGTGQMAAGLREGSLDVAIALTEGLVADLVKGNPAKIVSHFVKSPLRWGIHVAGGSTHKTVADLENKRFGISRMGSGSHLMAYVLAQTQGWKPEALEFVVVGGLAQARDAMKDGTIDAFMWEQFTTKPLVYTGEWRCVGICPTPWPCFAVAATEEALAGKEAAVHLFCATVLRRAAEFKQQGGASVCRVSTDFGLKLEDAAEWFSATEWADAVGVDGQVLEQVVDVLRAVGVLKGPPVDLGGIVHRFSGGPPGAGK